MHFNYYISLVIFCLSWEIPKVDSVNFYKSWIDSILFLLFTFVKPADLNLLDEFALRLLCLKSVGQFAAQLRPRPGLQYDLNSDLYSSLLAKPQLV